MASRAVGELAINATTATNKPTARWEKNRSEYFRSPSIIRLYHPPVTQLNDSIAVPRIFLGMGDLDNGRAFAV
ncbi:MAG: hypothetical protein QOI34_1590 [Verrucomicrobiota bacterium]